MDIVITPEYQRCFDYIDDDVPIILVSGEAGTGKSVLISEIEKRYPVRSIVKVAPTGIAALNIGGQTMHSFFRLSLGVLTAKKIFDMIGKMMRYGTGQYDSIDMLIIEEISMVRADALDAIDTILRKMRRSAEPFGGVQVIIVGDMFQLPPVVTEEDEDRYYEKYDNEYFFCSSVFKRIDQLSIMEVVMLTTGFRQKDEVYRGILNEIRVNKRTKHNIHILNQLCYYEPNEWDGPDITLCMTNARAQQINSAELRKIKEPEFSFKAKFTEGFKLKIVTPELLVLKVGARVMFTKIVTIGLTDRWVLLKVFQIIPLW